MQTPYVYPQENGNRVDARWVELRAPDGHGLRVEGQPQFDFAARRWTSESLDAARHTTDLVPDDVIHLNVDIGQTGLGSGSCGPEVAAAYQLWPRAAELTVVFRPLPAADSMAGHSDTESAIRSVKRGPTPTDRSSAPKGPRFNDALGSDK